MTPSKNLTKGNQIRLQKKITTLDQFGNQSLREFNAYIVSVNKGPDAIVVKIKSKVEADLDKNTEVECILETTPEGLVLNCTGRGGFSFRVLYIVPKPGMIFDNNEYHHFIKNAGPDFIMRGRNSRYQRFELFENIHYGEEGPMHIFVAITSDYHAIIDPTETYPERYKLYAYTESTLEASDFRLGSDYCPVVKATGEVVCEFEA